MVADIGVLGFCSGMSSSEQEFFFGILGSQKGWTEIVWTCPESEEKNPKVGSTGKGPGGKAEKI